MAAALGVEPSCPASKAGALAGGAASNWCSVTVSIRRLRFEGPRCWPLHQRSRSADWEDRTPDPGLEDQHVTSTPNPQDGASAMTRTSIARLEDPVGGRKQLDMQARVELACRVLQTVPWPSGSCMMAAPPGVDPRSRGSEPRALPLSYGASNGQGGRLRSCDLVRPGHALYQTKLHPDGAHGRSRTCMFSPVTSDPAS
jgi:hypothetical protein